MEVVGYDGLIPPATRIEVEYICRNSMGLTLLPYFSSKWVQNLHSQTTMRRYGANTMQPPLDPGEVGV
jgi:hypothetical protein